MLRLFVAVEVPDAVKQRLQEVQQQLGAVLRTDYLRLAPREQLHLTLRFLGAVPAGSVDNLVAALRSAVEAFASLELNASGLGCFPNPRRPRVIWAGVQEAAGRLEPLQAAVERAVHVFSREPAEEAFHPHLTLARVKEGSRIGPQDIEEAFRKSQGLSFGQWTAGCVNLMKSELSPRGARHSVIVCAPLKPPPISL